MKNKRYNPEKRDWRGRSYKTAGTASYKPEGRRISTLKLKAFLTAEKESKFTG